MMAGTGTGPDRTLAQADAVYEAQVDTQWREWRRYLQAHQNLLAARAADAPLAFEENDNLDAVAKQAHADLAMLATPRRVLFDAVVEQYRTTLIQELEAARRTAGGRSPAVDIDDAERQVFETLLDSAGGCSTPDGRGLVPMARDAQGEAVWYSVDCLALDGVPEMEAFTVGKLSAREQRRRLLGILALVLGTLLFVPAWFFWLAPQPVGGDAAVPAQARVNDRVPDIWPVTGLVLTTAGGHATRLSVQASPAFPPPAPGDRAVAFQQSALSWPLTICVPGTDLAEFTMARVTGPGAVPDRVYVLQDAPPAQPDLVLTGCDPGSDTGQRRGGVLQQTLPPAPLNVGDEGLIDASGDSPAQIVVRSIQAVGPGEEPTLPQNQQQVLVSLGGTTDLDWPRFAPHLLLMDGYVAPMVETRILTDGIALRYVIPLTTAPSEVVWQVTRPDTGQALRWRTTLEPPPDRAAILARTLVVQDIAADPLLPGEPLRLNLLLSNRGTVPLQLEPADIALFQEDTRLPTPDIPELRMPILTDERRTATLAVSLHPSLPLTVAIGTQRFQITLAP